MNDKVKNYIDSISWFKVIYIFSSLVTLFGFIGMGWSFYTGNFLDLLLIVPIFTLFYPIALIGTVAYAVKKVLQRKSIFELMQMSGASSGIGNLMDIGGQKNDDGETDEQED